MEKKIFVATHKKSEFPESNMYIPIQVGAAQKEDFGYLKDNEGDNISHKNSNYCELTALYWMWKNCKSDVVGLVHYRRYFFKNRYSTKWNNILSENDVEKIMTRYDIILPKKQYIAKYNLQEQWDKIHNKNDYEICENIISEKYPEYLPALHNVFKNRAFYAFNMFIAKREIIEKYCEWLFDILFELEKRVDVSSYDKYNQRIFGFLSERLFNVWLEKNREEIKIKEQTVLQLEENIIKQDVQYLLKKIYVDVFFTKNINLLNILIGVISFFISAIFYYKGLNYITSAILMITGLGLFYLAKKKEGYFTNPQGIFSLTWFCTIGLSTLQLHQDQVDWKVATWFYLGLAYIMFNIGYAVKCIEQNKKQKNKQNEKEPTNKKTFFYFIIAMNLCVVVAFILEVIIRGYIPMFSKDMASYQKFGVTGIHYFTVSCAIVLPITYIYWDKYKKSISKKEFICLIIMNLISLTIPFLIVSRQLILTTIVLTGFTIMGLKRTKELKIILIIVLVVLLTWFVISKYRNQNNEYLKQALNIQEDAVLSVGNMQVYMYIAVNYDNFNINVGNLEQYCYGIKSFFPVFALTGLKFVIPSISETADITKRVIPVYNTYPIVMTPYEDFGVLGIVLYMFIVGYICCLIEEISENNPVNILIKSLFKYALLFSFFTSYFSNATFCFYVIILLIGKMVFFEDKFKVMKMIKKL